MRDIYVVSCCRTAIGSFGGSLTNTPAPELGAIVIKEALKRAGLAAENVDEVMMGNILTAGLGQNPTRQAAVKAGVPLSVPAYTIGMVCGSGMKAVIEAARAIAAGDAEIIVAGGMENMSAAPYALPGARFGMKMDVAMSTKGIVDTMVKDGLWDAFNNYHMGVTAENVAEQWGLTREELDEFSVISQQRAEKAVDSGVFDEEIVPVTIPQRKGDPIVFDKDEHLTRGSTMEKVAKLKPAFKKDGGVVTAANASGINDSGAAVVVMSKEKADELGIKPMATIKSYASGGVDPSIMGVGPVPASRKALEKAGLTIEDMDLVEANEAFAAQSLAVRKDLGLDPEKTNVNGGAIALGHPIGASGCRILITLLYEMQRRGSHYGLATLCIGGGMGTSVIVEM